MNSYIIPMDFNSYTFANILNEWKKNKRVMWKAPGEVAFDKNGNPSIRKTSNIAMNIAVGDVIYIYVCNLPSESMKGKSRILLRGVVKEKPKPMPRFKAIFSKDNTEIDDDSWMIAFAIEDIITLKATDLKNDSILSREDLQERFDFLNPQGNRWPNTVSGTLDDKLIRYVERKFDETTDFLSLIEHFNKKCYFSNITKGSHKTFTARNGTDYFERHHFIQRKTAQQHKKLLPIIESPDNMICLCANCHRKLHCGSIDEIQEMLEILWKDKNVGKKIKGPQLNKAIGVKNDKEAFEWLLETYYVE